MANGSNNPINVQETLQQLLSEFVQRDQTIGSLQRQVAAYNQKLNEVQEVATKATKANAVAQDEVRKAQAERDEWKKKCETMGDHPDVVQAALKRAERAHADAAANLERLRGKAKPAEAEPKKE